MSYKALINFIDTQDNNRKYRAGDTYPCSGAVVPEERILQLAGAQNSLKKPVIARADDEPSEKLPEKPAENAASEDETPADEEKPTEKKRGRKKQ